MEIETCTVPIFPVPIDGYVLTSTKDGLLLCGGYNIVSRTFYSECYLLTENGEWLEKPSLGSKRAYSASIEVDGNWWITGKKEMTDHTKMKCYNRWQS